MKKKLKVKTELSCEDLPIGRCYVVENEFPGKYLITTCDEIGIKCDKFGFLSYKALKDNKDFKYVILDKNNQPGKPKDFHKFIEYDDIEE